MSVTTQAVFGLIIVLIALLLGRWASRYDVKSWFTDAIWRFLRRGGWRDIAKADIKSVLEKDQELKRQIIEKTDAFKSDAARIGSTRAVAKHGAMWAVAYAVNLIAGPVMIIGLLVLAHATWRWLA